MSLTSLSGTATTTKSPAAAAPAAVAAFAEGPSSSTRSFNVSGPLELAMTTSWPCAIAARAICVPTSPAPMMPMTVLASDAQAAGHIDDAAGEVAPVRARQEAGRGGHLLERRDPTDRM